MSGLRADAALDASVADVSPVVAQATGWLALRSSPATAAPAAATRHNRSNERTAFMRTPPWGRVCAGDEGLAFAVHHGQWR